jgi:hypothetical protein
MEITTGRFSYVCILFREKLGRGGGEKNTIFDMWEKVLFWIHKTKAVGEHKKAKGKH